MRRRNSTKPFLIIFMLLMISACGFEYYMIHNLTEENLALNTQLDTNTKVVYVATRDIVRGETIDDEGMTPNVQMEVVASGLEESLYITEEDLGSIAVVDIASTVPVMKNMITPIIIQKDSREYESYAVNLMTDQKVYDVIDVRISFPSGEDFIVLAKKEIMKMDLMNCIFTIRMNEEEIVRMNSAIVDAYITKGAKLYTTRYVESNLQEEAVPNYPVKAATRDLIGRDPNIITKAEHTLNQEAREKLEQHLRNVTENESSAIESYNSDGETRKNNYITEEAERLAELEDNE